MVQSILDDIKAQFNYGNMITRIILVNLFFLIAVNLFKVFTPPGSTFFTDFIQYLALPSDTFKWFTRPWTFVTHMFTHIGLWHFAWNMLMLYWFGRIVGDLIGDRKILPLYLIGGLAGGVFYLMWVQVSGVGGYALGASGAVMCFVLAAAFLAPDYYLNLLFIGPVKLKYVAVAIVLIDLLFNSASNPGGTSAHLGGAIMGGLYVFMLQRGTDLTSPLQRLFSKDQMQRKRAKSKAPMTVVYNRKRPERSKPERTEDDQDRIDAILDKINASGYDSLSKEEKAFLYEASKK